MYLNHDAARERLEMRQDKDAFRQLDWGSWEASFHPDEYKALIAQYPDLHSMDEDIKRRAWCQFLNSSKSENFRVKNRGLSR